MVFKIGNTDWRKAARYQEGAVKKPVKKPVKKAVKKPVKKAAKKPVKVTRLKKVLDLVEVMQIRTNRLKSAIAAAAIRTLGDIADVLVGNFDDIENAEDARDASVRPMIPRMQRELDSLKVLNTRVKDLVVGNLADDSEEEGGGEQDLEEHGGEELDDDAYTSDGSAGSDIPARVNKFPYTPGLRKPLQMIPHWNNLKLDPTIPDYVQYDLDNPGAWAKSVAKPVEKPVRETRKRKPANLTQVEKPPTKRRRHA